ncbi:MAG: DUF4338 domain-containing protein [Verrucomicrobiota bacterium]
MEGITRCRGREITGEQLESIRSLIASNPAASRRALSVKLCEAWNWRQPNGQLSDMVCRGLMLQLHRAGLIKLPPKRYSPPNPLARERSKPPRIGIDQTPIRCSVKDLGPLEIRQVRRSELEEWYNSLIEYHHYLGYTHAVGEQLKFLVSSFRRPIGCFTFSSASRHLAPRDRFIGWSADQRKANIHLIAYNSRFLIPPWVQVRHLASHLLGRIAGEISEAWEEFYRHPIYFMETFVDTERFIGSCYRAANWIYLGETTGRGKDDQTHKQNRSLKAVFGYPLCKDFRARLCSGQGGF